jgi:flagellar biosynthesis chaperone FliJ
MNRMEGERIAELAQLLRLRRLREEAARIERDAKRAERDAAQAAVAETEREVERLRLERAALAAAVAGEMAASMPRLGPFAISRREVLDDLFERAEYALIDDEEALAEAQEALEEAHAVWLQARARCEAVEQLDRRTRRGVAQAVERRTERELDAAPRVGLTEDAR